MWPPPGLSYFLQTNFSRSVNWASFLVCAFLSGLSVWWVGGVVPVSVVTVFSLAHFLFWGNLWCIRGTGICNGYEGKNSVHCVGRENMLSTPFSRLGRPPLLRFAVLVISMLIPKIMSLWLYCLSVFMSDAYNVPDAFVVYPWTCPPSLPKSNPSPHVQPRDNFAIPGNPRAGMIPDQR